jgi:hypothetical protein
METPRLVALAGASHAGRPPRDLPVASQDTVQAGQTVRALTLDEIIVWNLKEFGYGG